MEAVACLPDEGLHAALAADKPPQATWGADAGLAGMTLLDTLQCHQAQVRK